MNGLGRFVVAQLTRELEAEQIEALIKSQPATSSAELPRENGRRGASRLVKLDELLTVQAPARTSPLERLEQLDGELAALLVTQTPATWIQFRRSWRALVQSARRELITNGAVPKQLQSRRPAAPPAARRSRSERSRDPP